LLLWSFKAVKASNDGRNVTIYSYPKEVTKEQSTNLGISIFTSAILMEYWQPNGKRQCNKVYFARASSVVAPENHHKSWCSLKCYNATSAE
jgi:hypothetical protein